MKGDVIGLRVYAEEGGELHVIVEEAAQRFRRKNQRPRKSGPKARARKKA
jgi:hypothetical protein